MRRFGWPVAPAVIGLILGPVAETNLRRALVAVFLPPLLRRVRSRRDDRAEVSPHRHAHGHGRQDGIPLVGTAPPTPGCVTVTLRPAELGHVRKLNVKD